MSIRSVPSAASTMRASSSDHPLCWVNGCQRWARSAAARSMKREANRRPGCTMPRHEAWTTGPHPHCCRCARGNGKRPGRTAVQALRLHRPVHLPLPLAERPLHEERRLRDRPSPQPEARVHAAQQGRQADRPARHEPRRRLQPRLHPHHQGGGAPPPRRRPPLEAAAHRQPAPQPRQALARRGDRRAHPQAPPGLGRDRLEPEAPRRPRPDHSPRQELHRGPALHRGPPQPEDTHRPDDPPKPRLPYLPPRAPFPEPPREPAPQALRAHVPHAPPGRRQARQPLPRLGVHGGEPPEPPRSRAPHPRPRLRPARRHEPAGPQRAGQLAHLHRRHRPGPDRRGGRPDRPPHRGHDHRPLLPDEGVPARRAFHVRPARPARTARRDDLQVLLQHPALGARPGGPAQGPRRPLRPRAAREPGRVRREQRQVDVERAQRAVLCRGVGGLRGRGRAAHPHRAERPVALQHRRRPHAAGLSSAAVPGPGVDPPAGLLVASRLPEERPERDRHAAPVLRRQLAGRDHGRRADGAGAGLRPRRARRARDELLDAAPAQRRLRRLLAGPLRRLPQAARAPALAGPDPAAVGPWRGERLRAAHDAPAAAEHAGSSRVDARRVRRPPGRRRDRADNGPDDRRARAPAGPRRRAITVLEPLVRRAAHSVLPVRRLGPGVVGLGHAAAAARQPAEPGRRGPAQPPAQRAERTAAEVGVPEGGGRRGARLRRRALLREWIHRPVANLRSQMPPLPLLVFVVGTGSLGAEIAAVRLLAPYFGASTIVWANTIGIVLVALSIGYWLGGRLADRHPHMRGLCLLALAAAGLLALVPFAADPLLDLGVEALDSISAGAFIGSLLGVLVLVAVPVMLLGAVSPYAIRLAVSTVEEAGTVAGRLYALSTAGSLAGTLVSALLLIPLVGTRRTFLIFALAIAYPDGHRTLELNEGQAQHSVFGPDTVLTGDVWDGHLVLGFAAFDDLPDRVAILGNAAGTTARAFEEFFPDTRVDGVEIDAELSDIGREYFDMNNPSLHLYHEDARPFLRRIDADYDVISVDAYRQPYIPFYLATEEFFELVRDRLAPGGVVVVNAGHPEGQDDLEKVLSATMAEVFPNVLRDPIEDTNTLLVASEAPVSAESLRRAAPGLPRAIRDLALTEAARLGPRLEGGDVYTDDKAPVE